MVCVYCHSPTQVTNSRHQKRLNHIWRRRKCYECGAVFTTSEIVDLLKSLSVKKGKHFEPFSRDTLFLTIYESVKHRKQASNDAIGLTDTVIAHLYPLISAGSITTTEIIRTTSTILKRFDKAAATHYLAFHPL